MTLYQHLVLLLTLQFLVVLASKDGSQQVCVSWNCIVQRVKSSADRWKEQSESLFESWNPVKVLYTASLPTRVQQLRLLQSLSSVRMTYTEMTEGKFRQSTDLSGTYVSSVATTGLLSYLNSTNVSTTVAAVTPERGTVCIGIGTEFFTSGSSNSGYSIEPLVQSFLSLYRPPAILYNRNASSSQNLSIAAFNTQCYKVEKRVAPANLNLKRRTVRGKEVDTKKPHLEFEKTLPPVLQTVGLLKSQSGIIARVPRADICPPELPFCERVERIIQSDASQSNRKKFSSPFFELIVYATTPNCFDSLLCAEKTNIREAVWTSRVTLPTLRIHPLLRSFDTNLVLKSINKNDRKKPRSVKHYLTVGIYNPFAHGSFSTRFPTLEVTGTPSAPRNNASTSTTIDIQMQVPAEWIAPFDLPFVKLTGLVTPPIQNAVKIHDVVSALATRVIFFGQLTLAGPDDPNAVDFSMSDIQKPLPIDTLESSANQLIPNQNDIIEPLHRAKNGDLSSLSKSDLIVMLQEKNESMALALNASKADAALALNATKDRISGNDSLLVLPGAKFNGSAALNIDLRSPDAESIFQASIQDTLTLADIHRLYLNMTPSTYNDGSAEFPNFLSQISLNRTAATYLNRTGFFITSWIKVFGWAMTMASHYNPSSTAARARSKLHVYEPMIPMGVASRALAIAKSSTDTTSGPEFIITAGRNDRNQSKVDWKVSMVGTAFFLNTTVDLKEGDVTYTHTGFYFDCKPRLYKKLLAEVNISYTEDDSRRIEEKVGDSKAGEVLIQGKLILEERQKRILEFQMTELGRQLLIEKKRMSPMPKRPSLQQVGPVDIYFGFKDDPSIGDGKVALLGRKELLRKTAIKRDILMRKEHEAFFNKTSLTGYHMSKVTIHDGRRRRRLASHQLYMFGNFNFTLLNLYIDERVEDCLVDACFLTAETKLTIIGRSKTFNTSVLWNFNDPRKIILPIVANAHARKFFSYVVLGENDIVKYNKRLEPETPYVDCDNNPAHNIGQIMAPEDIYCAMMKHDPKAVEIDCTRMHGIKMPEAAQELYCATVSMVKAKRKVHCENRRKNLMLNKILTPQAMHCHQQRVKDIESKGKYRKTCHDTKGMRKRGEFFCDLPSFHPTFY